MGSALQNMVYSFLVALGVLLGASIFAGIGAVVNNHPPLKTMFDMAQSLKIWAAVVALGGTFSSFEILEKGLFQGEFRSIMRQSLFVLMALLGSNTGYLVVKMLHSCGDK